MVSEEYVVEWTPVQKWEDVPDGREVRVNWGGVNGVDYKEGVVDFCSPSTSRKKECHIRLADETGILVCRNLTGIELKHKRPKHQPQSTLPRVARRNTW